MKSVLLTLVLGFLLASLSLHANTPKDNYPSKDIIITVPYVGKVILKTCSPDLIQSLQSLALIDKFIKDPNTEIVQAYEKKEKLKASFKVHYTETTE